MIRKKGTALKEGNVIIRASALYPGEISFNFLENNIFQVRIFQRKNNTQCKNFQIYLIIKKRERKKKEILIIFNEKKKKCITGQIINGTFEMDST